MEMRETGENSIRVIVTSQEIVEMGYSLDIFQEPFVPDNLVRFLMSATDFEKYLMSYDDHDGCGMAVRVHAIPISDTEVRYMIDINIIPMRLPPSPMGFNEHPFGHYPGFPPPFGNDFNNRTHIDLDAEKDSILEKLYGEVEEYEDGTDTPHTLEHGVELKFKFKDIEDIIKLTPRLISMGLVDTSLYFYDNSYILLISSLKPDKKLGKNIASVVLEYGELSNVTNAMLDEYGNAIVIGGALKKFKDSF